MDGEEKGRGSGEEGEAGGEVRLERERERELDSRHTVSATLFPPLPQLCMNMTYLIGSSINLFMNIPGRSSSASEARPISPKKQARYHSTTWSRFIRVK